MDYDGISVILLFAACQRRSCVNVTIIDDEMLENTESFNFTLERTTGLSDRITLDPVDGVVEIIDDDGTFVSSITFFVFHFLSQMLWLVWRRHTTMSQRVWVWLKCVL